MENGQIYSLIGQAMREIGAIGKTSVNQQQGFKYRGIDAVYNALNPVMAKYGLFICPEILDMKREERASRNGGSLIDTVITMRYSVYAPDGSNICCTVVGEGMDSGDKSANKAMSVAMKYAMFQLFFIPTEELIDPDAECHEVAPKAKNENKPKSKAVATPPAAVKTVDKVPEAKPVSEVQAYVNNELAFMAQRFEISDRNEMKARFKAMRKALIDAGVIQDIKGEDMTMAQAKEMFEAMYANFLTDGDDK